MKILLLLAKGFETMEFSPFIDVFGWARDDFGHDISVVTCGIGDTVRSAFNVPVCVDVKLADVCSDEYAALAIPGGFEEYGFYEDSYSEPFLDIICEFEKQGKPIASICVAAFPLGKSGILQNRKATTYHLRDGFKQAQLKEYSNQVVNEPVVVDKNVITSYCPETAPKVAFTLLEMLTSQGDAQKVMKAMGW